MERIHALCRSHGVRSLHAFGSAARGEENDQSDVDLLLESTLKDPKEYTMHYFALIEGLEELFGRSVDLLDQGNINNPYRLQLIDRDKVKLYGA